MPEEGTPFLQGEKRERRLDTDKLLEYKNQMEGLLLHKTTLLFLKLDKGFNYCEMKQMSE